jgi:hypothetical protein
MECSDQAGDHMPPDDPKSAHLRVRIEPKLLERLDKARKWRRRTMAGEITERLEDSFRHDDITDAVSNVSSDVESAVDDAVYGALKPVSEELKQIRAELHQIRTELQELRRAVAPPPSTLLYPPTPRPDGEQK